MGVEHVFCSFNYIDRNLFSYFELLSAAQRQFQISARVFSAAVLLKFCFSNSRYLFKSSFFLCSAYLYCCCIVMLFFATQLEKRVANRGGIASIYNWKNYAKALSKGLT